jgi:hypothetical protein
MASIIRFDVNDKLCLKKKHPCGSDVFTVARGGSDVRIICDGCGRDLTLEREMLEKMIKKVIKTEK